MSQETSNRQVVGRRLDRLVGRFFVNTGDGIEFVDSKQEAERLCDAAIAEYRSNAASDGEWCDDVEAVCWGIVMAKSEADYSQDCDDSEIDYCDYGLADLPPVE